MMEYSNSDFINCELVDFLEARDPHFKIQTLRLGSLGTSKPRRGDVRRAEGRPVRLRLGTNPPRKWLEILAKGLHRTQDYWPGSLLIEGQVGEVESLRRLLLHEMIFSVARRLAQTVQTPGPVLLVGETGTGKSTLARTLHQLHRAGGRLVEVNVSAIHGESLETRMRGVEEGVYSSVAEACGWFELADNGLLFLDEFQDSSPAFQAALLDLLAPTTDRVEVQRVGGQEEPKEFDVRVLLAVNRPISRLLESQALRPDLRWRMRREISLPSLRDRLGGPEGPPLLQTLLAASLWIRHARGLPGPSLALFDEGAVERLRGHEWPGNFRELDRLIEITLDGLWLVRQMRPTAPSFFADIPPSQLPELPGPIRSAGGSPEREDDREPSCNQVDHDDEVRLAVGQAMSIALRAAGGRYSLACRSCGLLGMRSPTKFRAMIKELGDYLSSDVRAMEPVRRILEEA